MGSWNVSCAASHISIGYGDKVKFFFLFPSLINYKQKSVAELTGTQRFHGEPLKIFCLPIEGIYDDYGGIEKIKRDENVEAIERYFDDMPIETIFENVKEQARTGHKVLDILSGCFVLKDVYDALVKISFRSGKQNNRINEAHLHALGFERTDNFPKNISKRKDYSRYNRILSHPKIQDFYIMSDGEYTLSSPYYEDLEYVYNVKDFRERILNKFQVDLFENNTQIECDSKLINYLFQFNSGEQPSVQFYAPHGPGLHTHKVYKNVDLLANLKKLLELEYVMETLFSCNIALEPSICGPQNGEDEIHLKFVKNVTKILNKKIAKRTQ